MSKNLFFLGYQKKKRSKGYIPGLPKGTSSVSAYTRPIVANSKREIRARATIVSRPNQKPKQAKNDRSDKSR
jgi:ribulose bisphosphate carboxylase small subunit